MSLVLSTANYTQFEKDFFITEAVIGLDTVNKGLMYVATGVKNDQYAFPVLSAAPKLQAYGSTPTASGTTTLSNRLLTLGKFQAYEEFEPSVFENHWHKDELADRLLARSLPTTFQNYLTTYYTQKTFKPIEEMIHIGSTSYVTTSGGSAATGGVNEQRIYFDGIIKTALNATTPALQVASPSAITSANVISKMEAAKNKLGSTTSGIALLSRANRYDRLKYVMSVVDALKYEDALTTTTYKNNDTTERGLNKYKGYEVVVVAGLPENTFYFGEFAGDLNSNLQLAVTDMDNLSFEINRLQNNSALFFYKAIMKMGVGIAKPSEFVIHTTYVLSDFSV
jgi:hypothetical protein